MGLSSLKGNGGFLGLDYRGTIDNPGLLSVKKLYLERLGGNLGPLGSKPTLGMSVWYNSNNAIISGSDVGQLTDLSTNNLDIVGVSNPPQYNSNDINFNNNPSLSFNFDDFMGTSNSSVLDIDSNNGFTLYIVCKINNFPSTYSFLTTRTNGTSWTQGFGMMYFSNNWRFWVNNYNFTNTRVNMGSWSNFSDVHIFKLHYDKINIKGEIIGPSSVGPNLASYSNSITNPSSGIRIGDGNSGTYDIDMDMAEYLYYNRALNSDEELETELYLKNKFNIS